MTFILLKNYCNSISDKECADWFHAKPAKEKWTQRKYRCGKLCCTQSPQRSSGRKEIIVAITASLLSPRAIVFHAKPAKEQRTQRKYCCGKLCCTQSPQRSNGRKEIIAASNCVSRKARKGAAKAKK